MGGWFEKATLVEWIVVVGMTVGLLARAFEAWVKTRQAVEATNGYVTKEELSRRLLEADRDQKHWVRSQFTGYVPAEVHTSLTQRVDRIEDRVERLEGRH